MPADQSVALMTDPDPLHLLSYVSTLLTARCAAVGLEAVQQYGVALCSALSVCADGVEQHDRGSAIIALAVDDVPSRYAAPPARTVRSGKEFTLRDLRLVHEAVAGRGRPRTAGGAVSSQDRKRGVLASTATLPGHEMSYLTEIIELWSEQFIIVFTSSRPPIGRTASSPFCNQTRRTGRGATLSAAPVPATTR